tara:strand:+ start:33120 stop:33638 length:519 start_codon:yes stop_codon:yes gene_type:complete
MWGAKRGPWITSYLGYLQQYFDIVFYDCQQLANMDIPVETEENIREAFRKEGAATAVAHLLNRESGGNSHFLAFGIGGAIAMRAVNKGLRMKSLYAVSSPEIPMDIRSANFRVTLLYGSNDTDVPVVEWELAKDLDLERVPHFGHTLYSDEKIIQKICRELLGRLIKKQLPV